MIQCKQVMDLEESSKSSNPVSMMIPEPINEVIHLQRESFVSGQLKTPLEQILDIVQNFRIFKRHMTQIDLLN